MCFRSEHCCLSSRASWGSRASRHQKTHFDPSRNLPYLVDEICKVTSDCSACATMKPWFHSLPAVHSIKATSFFERLSIDFKGPLSVNNLRDQCTSFLLDVFHELFYFYFCKNKRVVPILQVVFVRNALLIAKTWYNYFHKFMKSWLCFGSKIVA